MYVANALKNTCQYLISHYYYFLSITYYSKLVFKCLILLWGSQTIHINQPLRALTEFRKSFKNIKDSHFYFRNLVV